jgi:molecular chaperone GrpE (heat shock protein)
MGESVSDEADPADETAVLADLTAGIGRLEGQLAEFHRRSAHRESVIDRLHEENQRLRSGTERIVLEPVITDLIRLHDQLDREARRLAADGGDGLLLRSFADEIAQVLDRCGIELFSASPGDPFERGRHHPLTVVACDDSARHNTVAEVVAAGFSERESGRVRRPAQVRVFQHTPASQ